MVNKSQLGFQNADAIEKKLNSTSSYDKNPWWAQRIIDLVLILLCFTSLVPMLNVLATSLSSSSAIYSSKFLLFPRELTFEAYKYIFSTSVLLRSFGITVFATVVGTALNLIFTVTGAYALSRTDVPGHKLMLWWTVIPMMLGAGLIPVYLLLRDLKLLDSVWVLIIPQLVAPFNVILMRNFFWSIPDALSESASIDGASELRVLISIILPLSAPSIATVGLFYAVGHWNDYFTGLYFINTNTKWPLQVLLRSIVVDFNLMNMGTQSGMASMDAANMKVQAENIKAASIVFATVPILVVYPFLQRYFVKGILIGSVKG